MENGINKLKGKFPCENHMFHNLSSFHIWIFLGVDVIQSSCIFPTSWVLFFHHQGCFPWICWGVSWTLWSSYPAVSDLPTKTRPMVPGTKCSSFIWSTRSLTGVASSTSSRSPTGIARLVLAKRCSCQESITKFPIAGGITSFQVCSLDLSDSPPRKSFKQVCRCFFVCFFNCDFKHLTLLVQQFS